MFTLKAPKQQTRVKLSKVRRAPPLDPPCPGHDPQRLQLVDTSPAEVHRVLETLFQQGVQSHEVSNGTLTQYAVGRPQQQVSTCVLVSSPSEDLLGKTKRTRVRSLILERGPKRAEEIRSFEYRAINLDSLTWETVRGSLIVTRNKCTNCNKDNFNTRVWRRPVVCASFYGFCFAVHVVTSSTENLVFGCDHMHRARSNVLYSFCLGRFTPLSLTCMANAVQSDTLNQPQLCFSKTRCYR